MHIMSPLEAETFMPTASSPVFHTRAQTYVHMYIYLYIYTYIHRYRVCVAVRARFSRINMRFFTVFFVFLQFC